MTQFPIVTCRFCQHILASFCTVEFRRCRPMRTSLHILRFPFLPCALQASCCLFLHSCLFSLSAGWVDSERTCFHFFLPLFLRLPLPCVRRGDNLKKFTSPPSPLRSPPLHALRCGEKVTRLLTSCPSNLLPPPPPPQLIRERRKKGETI